MEESMTTGAIELSRRDCELLLTSVDVGRIAVIDHGYPLVFPINYKVAYSEGHLVIAIRTRPDNVIDHPGRPVCFEIDGLDADHAGGWSVLVRGFLVQSPPAPERDSKPLDAEDRDAWRVIIPTRVSGRRVHNRTERWSFHPAGYV